MMDNFTVPENKNSYTVTGLSDNDNYNVSVAIVGVCGMITSDPITIYGKSTCTCIHVCSVRSLQLVCYDVYVYSYTHVYMVQLSCNILCAGGSQASASHDWS